MENFHIFMTHFLQSIGYVMFHILMLFGAFFPSNEKPAGKEQVGFHLGVLALFNYWVWVV